MRHILFFILSIFLCNNTIISTDNAPETIYGLMITGKEDMRYFFALNAIKNFFEQTYPNKHLIIVNHGNYTLNGGNKDITEMKIEKRSLGAMRNIGLQNIPENAVWLYWDDDDWRHEKLIEEQYKHMINNNADLCLPKKQVQYAFKINAAWIAKSGGGTAMCRKKKDIEFAEKQRGEDTTFLMQYTKKYHSTIWSNRPYYYIRLIHDFNTSGIKHFNLEKQRKNHLKISKKGKEFLLSLIPMYTFLSYLY